MAEISVEIKFQENLWNGSSSCEAVSILLLFPCFLAHDLKTYIDMWFLKLKLDFF